MTIKQQGGIFGRNPSFNDTEANDLIVNDTLGVGSGTPATNAKAHISRASSGASVLSGTTLALESTGDVILDMLSPATGRALIVFGNASSSQRGDLLYDHSADTLRVRVGNTTQATFNTSGLAFPNGKGIDFSATAGTGTSELFDDYEEGTWTPADASAGGLTFSVAEGIYTKIGRLVNWQCVIRYPSTADTNVAQINGFPFALANPSAGRSGSFVSVSSISAIVNTLQIESTPTLRLYKAGFVQATNAEVSGGDLYLAGFYTTS